MVCVFVPVTVCMCAFVIVIVYVGGCMHICVSSIAWGKARKFH